MTVNNNTGPYIFSVHCRAVAIRPKKTNNNYMACLRVSWQLSSQITLLPLLTLWKLTKTTIRPLTVPVPMNESNVVTTF